MMYEKFNNYLLKNTRLDDWYEKEYEMAQIMLTKFREDDWRELTNNVFYQSINYQKKLAYCIEKLKCS